MRKLTKHLLCVFTLIAMTASVEQAVAQNPGKLGDNVVVHIALVVRDINRSAKAYADLFGVEVPKISVTDPLEKTRLQFRGEPTQALAKLAFLRLENITIELVEPVGGPSTWREFLEMKGEGVHHIAFRVKGMEENIALLEKQGGKLIQKGDFIGGSYAYVDLTRQLGVIVELLTSANKK